MIIWDVVGEEKRILGNLERGNVAVGVGAFWDGNRMAGKLDRRCRGLTKIPVFRGRATKAWSMSYAWQKSHIYVRVWI